MIVGPRFEEIGEMRIKGLDSNEHVNKICECLENSGYSTALIDEISTESTIRILLKMEDD